MHIHPGTLNLSASMVRSEATQDKRIAEDRRKKLLTFGSFSDAITSSEGSWAVNSDVGGQDRSKDRNKDPSKDRSRSDKAADSPNAAVAPVSYWA